MNCVVCIEPGPRLNLLGQFEIVDGDRRVALPRDAQRLVAFLALRGRRVPRSFAAGSLWLEHNKERASGNLRSALWRVRKQVGSLLDCEASDLAIGSTTRVDVVSLAEVADRLASGAECREADLALKPYTEELLPGWYDEWVVIERERVRQLSLHVLEGIADRLATLGHHGAAVQAALRAIEADPLRESAHRCLIRVHLDEGNRSEAQRQFEFYRDLLSNELGFAPSQRMIDLMY